MCLRNSRKEACVAGVSKGVRSERRWGHRGTWYRTEVGACRAFEESAASAPPISLQHCPLDARKPSGFLLPLQLSVWGPLLATGVQQGRPGSQFPGSSPQPMWSWWIKYPGTLLLAFDNYEAFPKAASQRSPEAWSSGAYSGNPLINTPCIGFLPFLSHFPVYLPLLRGITSLMNHLYSSSCLSISLWSIPI